MTTSLRRSLLGGASGRGDLQVQVIGIEQLSDRLAAAAQHRGEADEEEEDFGIFDRVSGAVANDQLVAQDALMDCEVKGDTRDESSEQRPAESFEHDTDESR